MDYYMYDDYEPHLYEEEQYLQNFPKDGLNEIFLNCIIPSLKQIALYITILIIINIINRLGWIFICRFKISNSEHVVSIICGTGILLYAVGYGTLYLITFVIFNFLLSKILLKVKTGNIGLSHGIISFCLLTCFELFQSNLRVWNQIRGIQMICAMKSISIVCDMDTEKILKYPDFVSFCGYLFCPGNCVLGPWISYEEYLKSIKTSSKSYFRSAFWIITNAVIAMIFLVLSNCIVQMIGTKNSFIWIIAYRDALAFRCSHYFISYLSQATMVASGLTSTSTEMSSLLGHQVTKPLEIEIPRSLVQVVINWNIPMHRWLKQYVFRIIKPKGTALAIFLTYLISSILHGLNFQIAAVLLSLGCYTFVEYKLRYKIAEIFNACVLATKCKRTCSHHYKRYNLTCLAINIFFSILASFHLAYLGSIFNESLSQDDYGFEHTFQRWNNLSFLSHWTALISYIVFSLI